MAAVAAPQTPQRPLPGGYISTPAPAPTFFAQQAASLRSAPALATSNPSQQPRGQAPTSPSAAQISHIERAARTINDALALEARFPELEQYVTHGISGTYELPSAPTWQPYQKLKMHPLPPAIIEQANQTVGGLAMGVMPELGHCWAVMDNCLYLWDYTQQNPELIGYEENAHPITQVKLVKPKPGVFVKEIAHLIVVATTESLLLLGVATTTTGTGARTVALYNTRMSVSARGLNVKSIAASAKTGRIFFLDAGGEDVYEFQYQQEEGWFRGRCARVCHTQQSWDFAPAPVKALASLWQSTPANSKVLRALAIDDTRDLLYTLSAGSAIHVYAIEPPGRSLRPALARPLSGLLQSTAHFTGRSDLLYNSDVRLVDLAVIPATEAAKLSLMATTNTGCRLYLSATRGYGVQADRDNPPNSMQILHIRFPPQGSSQQTLLPSQSQSQPPYSGGQSSVVQYSGGQPQHSGSNVDLSTRTLTPISSALRFPPGYFLAFQPPSARQAGRERVFLSAPDFARLKKPQDLSSSEQRFVEYGQWVELPSEHSEIALVTKPFAARDSPVGFGNEIAVQFDETSAEFAIMTADGVQTIRRRRLVDVFASMMRGPNTAAAASTSSPGAGGGEEGREGDVKRFIRTYGRAETAATALAVACGQAVDVIAAESRVTSVTDAEVVENARKVFIEEGGRPEIDGNSVSGSDNVRPSPRHEGTALYVSRLVRSIWVSKMVKQSIAPGQPPALTPCIPVMKLRTVQRDLNTLQEFLARNKAFIEGLTTPSNGSSMRLGNRQEELALQGEHRAMTSLVALITNIIEGLAFVLVLFDERLEDILASLPDESKGKTMNLTFQDLFVSAHGRDLAKELVKAIVNRNIANGSNVDTVAEALRRRCGSFCSSEDVVIFKAQEQVKRASEAGGQTETGRVLLNESQRLLGKVAGSLSQEGLQWAVERYVDMSFYAGAIQLCLVVAQERDRAKTGWGYLKDGRVEGDARRAEFERREQCYQLIFSIIQALDAATKDQPQTTDNGALTLAARRRAEAYDVIDGSNDKAFQTCLYDWYLSQSQADRLLDISTPHVVDYLRSHAPGSRQHADLLWRYYAHQNDFLSAAATQLELARSELFRLALEERIGYLSRARTNASTRSSALSDARADRQVLLREISDLLDVAGIQMEILSKMRDDHRLVGERRTVVLDQLNTSGILEINELFNQFSDQAGYWDVNLLIYLVADHRNPGDIRRSWEELIKAEDVYSQAEGHHRGWERIGAKVLEMARRLEGSEACFPVRELVRMLEEYAIQPHENPPPEHWAVSVLVEAGADFAQIVAGLEECFYSNRAPFTGSKRRRLAEDLVVVCRQWVERGSESGVLCGSEEGAEMVRAVLMALVGGRELKEEGREEARRMLAVLEGRA